MSPTKWGIVSSGLISGDFVNSIFSLNNSTDHQVKITTFFKKIQYYETIFKKMLLVEIRLWLLQLEI